MQNSSSTVAIADIGSNTSLLLIARLSEDKEPEILEDRLFYTRLAEGFAQTKNQKKYIKESALKRQEQFFKTAQKLVQKYSAQQIKCVATSASRQASNQDQLIALGQSYGFAIDIISPEKEARLSQKGALFNLPVNPKKTVVLDIGGASTELSSAQNVFSLQIGSVNLTERFLPNNHPTKIEINRLEKHIEQEMQKIPFSVSKKNILVATAGTPTTLACLENQSPHWQDIHGTTLSLRQVDKWYKSLLHLSVEERKNLKGMPIYRADVMPAGLSVLKQIMCYFGFQQCLVSVTGLRYGLL